MHNTQSFKSTHYYMVLNPDYLIIDVSDSYLAYTKTKREEIIDRDVHEILATVYPDIPEANLSTSLEALINKLPLPQAIFQSIHIKKHSAESKYLWKLHGIPLQYQDKLQYIVLNLDLIDTSDAVENVDLQQIDAEKSHLETIIEFTHDAIVTKALDGTIQSWNHAAELLYGYSAQEIIGKNIQCLFPSEILDEYKSIQSKIRHGKPLYYADTKRQHKDGYVIPISVTITPLRNNKGIIVGACSIARDITPTKNNQYLRKKNQELTDLASVKNQFIANVSHELRTPLHGILGFANLMLEKKLGILSKNQKTYIHYIISSATNLHNLINDILDLSRIESGRMDFNFQQIQLRKLIQTIKNTLLPQLLAKNITFHYEIAPNLQTIICDNEKLKQIIFNYLTNSIKFTDMGGIISLKITKGKNNFRITIKDSGIGISDDNIHKLFTQFEQLDASYRKKYQGFGLGLALVKQFATALGGSVGVKSQLGIGSEFYVVLPVGQEDQLLKQV